MEYKEDEYLMLSGLQHFYFCKRQWALIHLEQQWGENEATMEGNYIHEKSDNPFIVESRDNLLISRAVPISSKKLGLSGILDVLELYREDKGVELNDKPGLWRPNIVEYKRGKPKKDHRDVIQLVAQVICLEEMFDTKIESSELYYNENNRRVMIKITDELREEAISSAQEMHRLYNERITPKAESYKNCTKCSLYDICLPRLTKKKPSVRNYIESFIISD